MCVTVHTHPGGGGGPLDNAVNVGAGADPSTMPRTPIDVPVAPVALAAPNATMEDPTRGETDSERARRLGLLRLGMQRTIATSSQGVTQQANTAAQTLYSPGNKTALGQ